MTVPLIAAPSIVAIIGNSKDPDGSKTLPVKVDPETTPETDIAMFNAVIFRQLES